MDAKNIVKSCRNCGNWVDCKYGRRDILVTCGNWVKEDNKE